MRFAWYGRKSVYKDNSDSIENQLRLCRNYTEAQYPGQIDSFAEYSDEDYTGANANRPDLQRLLNDIRRRRIDALIVYQLDRISRNVKDFSNIYAILEEYKVDFISIKENINTDTPMGRAMMYTTVVFANLERENIAERVTDNMIGLARKGLWLGGKPPCGYTVKQVESNGRKHMILELDPEGAEYMHWLFDLYLLKNMSTLSLESYFKTHNIRSRNGSFFSSSLIYRMLSAPYGVAATKEVYQYFLKKGCIMVDNLEAWDGTRGVMIYGRTIQKDKKFKNNPPDKWIIALGHHKPFLSAEKWLAVQEHFASNKIDKTTKHPTPLTKGLVYCRCGWKMQIIHRKRNNGQIYAAYYCQKRKRRGADECNNKQISVEKVDKAVLHYLEEIAATPSLIYNFTRKKETSVVDTRKIQKNIARLEQKIESLVSSLAMTESDRTKKYILAEIDKLDAELDNSKQILLRAQIISEQAADYTEESKKKASLIYDLIEKYDTLSNEERNQMLKLCVNRCTWDGDTIEIQI